MLINNNTNRVYYTYNKGLDVTTITFELAHMDEDSLDVSTTFYFGEPAPDLIEMFTNSKVASIGRELCTYTN